MSRAGEQPAGTPPAGRPAELRVLGMLSGTSADAIDVAVARIGDDGAGRAWLEPLGHGEIAWPPGLRERVLASMPPAPVDMLDVCELDTLLGQAFADGATAAISRWGPVDLIASHGQTLAHWTGAGQALGTLQLGAPAWINAATGVPVISHLRSGDIARGGHGAPLASTLDALWLGGQPTAVVNIGGIANLTMLGDGRVLTGDTGPGNCLIDVAAHRLTGAAYDDGGALAAAGRVDQDALQALLTDDFYSLPMPRSTGREYFDAGYVTRVLQRAGVPVPAGEDLIATLTELTARTIAGAVRVVGDMPAPTRVVVSGGGAANPVLMRALARHLPGVQTSTESGLPAGAKEGYLFALLGYLGARGLPGTVPADAPGTVQATGSRGPVVLGSLTPPAPAPCPAGSVAITSLAVGSGT